MVCVLMGQVESVERVDSVRYRFGRQGHSGTVGRLARDDGSASGSTVCRLLERVPASSAAHLSWIGSGRVVSLKSGQRE